jgi:hypothetical protein
VSNVVQFPEQQAVCTNCGGPLPGDSPITSNWLYYCTKKECEEALLASLLAPKQRKDKATA